MDISLLRDRPTNPTLTVSELNNYIKNLVDSSRTLNVVTVTGEISNFTSHRSGHLYFSIKEFVFLNNVSSASISFFDAMALSKNSISAIFLCVRRDKFWGLP